MYFPAFLNQKRKKKKKKEKRKEKIQIIEFFFLPNAEYFSFVFIRTLILKKKKKMC